MSFQESFSPSSLHRAEQAFQRFMAEHGSYIGAAMGLKVRFEQHLRRHFPAHKAIPADVTLCEEQAYQQLLYQGYPESTGYKDETAQLANSLAGWAAYRQTKTIYRFETKLSEGLVGCTWPKDLPTQALFLPSNGMICDVPALPGFDLTTDKVHPGERMFLLFHYGYQVRFQHRQINFSAVLPSGRLRALGAIELLDMPLHATLDHILEAYRKADWVKSHTPEQLAEYIGVAKVAFTAMLSHVLYLNGNDDIVAEVHPGTKPLTGKSPKAIQAKRDKTPPQLFTVGKQYASVIERWEVEHSTVETVDGETRTVRPHVRAAHSHLYWTGPRSGIIGVDRLPRVHFLPPILVKGGGDDGSERAPTIRRVK